MKLEYWVGLFTFPAVVLAALGLWSLFGVVSNLWGNLHTKMLMRVDLRTNTPVVRWRGDKSPMPEPRPKYEDAANKIRDALLTSPRCWHLFGLGWYAIVGRDIKREPEMDR